MTLARYQLTPGRPYGYDASLIEALFIQLDRARPNVEHDGVVVVSVDGPLEQRAGCGWDSYEAIDARVGDALAGPNTRAVVLKLSSPGGDAAGSVELARKLRADAEVAGKPLYAWVAERACSAAYILACAARSIVLSDSAIVGSIGVIGTRVDLSVQNTARGIHVEFFASGARKVDGHPDAPVSDGERAAQQRIIDSFAQVYFDFVAEVRGVDAKALDAGVYHGGDAIAQKLADQTLSFEALTKQLSTNNGILDMNPEEAARKALAEMAEGDDPKAARARAALAALDEAEKTEGEGDEPVPEGEGDEPAPEGEDEPHTEPDGDEPKPAKAKAAASARAIALEARADVHRLRAELASERDKSERDRLLAKRPDLDAGLRAMLADKATPLATVRKLVATLPRIGSGAGATAALAASQPDAKPTRGAHGGEPQGDPSAARLPPAERESLDERMGLRAHTTGVVNTESKLFLGVRVKGQV